jgi:hypothetical protein
MTDVTVTSLRQVAESLLVALQQESTVITENKASAADKAAQTAALVGQVFQISQQPLAALGKILSSLKDSLDKQGMDTRKTALVRAVKASQNLRVKAAYDRGTKLYTFEVVPEKETSFDSFVDDLLKKMDKAEYDNAVILLALQQALAERAAPQPTVDPLDDLI